MAIGLWRLATGNAFRTIAKTFGLGKFVLITHKYSTALSEKAGEYIQFPRTAVDIGEVVKFKENVGCKIPHPFAPVDCTLIEIAAPETPNKAGYFAYKISTCNAV